MQYNAEGINESETRLGEYLYNDQSLIRHYVQVLHAEEASHQSLGHGLAQGFTQGDQEALKVEPLHPRDQGGGITTAEY